MSEIDSSYRVTADELRQFIERIERLDAEKKDLAEQQKEVMAEAKGRGYDTKVMRKLISLRRRDQNDIAEEEEFWKCIKKPWACDFGAGLHRAGSMTLTSPREMMAFTSSSYKSDRRVSGSFVQPGKVISSSTASGLA